MEEVPMSHMWFQRSVAYRLAALYRMYRMATIEEGIETEGVCMTRVVKIKNKNDRNYDVYIGRANRWYGLKQSKWANPFPMDKDATDQEAERQRVLEEYEAWIRTQPELLAELPTLKGKVLGCWCKPEPCHGDVIVKLILDFSSRGLDNKC